MTPEPTLISSVRRALNLLDAVGESARPLPAKVLARRTGQPLPTTYHLLRTLVHEGYLTRVDGLGYVLGDQIASLSDGPGRQASRLARNHQALQTLHQELSSAAYLSVLVDGEIQLQDVVDSAAAPRVDLWVDFHEAAHATALGKAVLSALDEPIRLDYVAQHALPDLTPHTVTSRRVLLRELDHAGDLVLDREEYALGTACIAVAVPSVSMPAAVAVSVPAHRVQRILADPAALHRAAERIACTEVGVVAI